MSKNGFLLPDVLSGHDLDCIKIHVPQDEKYRRAFWGHLMELTKWYNWERTGGNEGKQAADYWRDLLLADLTAYWEGDRCGMAIYDIRAVGCELQVQRTPGGEWEVIGDFSTCGAVGPQGPPGEDGQDGADGRSPEMMAEAGMISWRLEGDVDWQGLLDVCELACGDEPPDPPGTGDTKCDYADYLAGLLVALVREIVQMAANNGWTSFAYLANFVTIVLREYPGYFGAGELVQMYLHMLAHVGQQFDYAPVLGSDDAAARAELRCAIYCSILEPGPKWKTDQLSVYAELTAPGGTMELIDPANVAARELLDVAWGWLGAEFLSAQVWSDWSFAANQAPETLEDCVACLCYEEPGPDPAQYVLNNSIAWVGAHVAGAGGELSGGVWSATDYLYGANVWRREVDLDVEVPHGDVVRVEVDYTTEGNTHTAGRFRLYATDDNSNVMLLYQLDDAAPDGNHTAVWEGQVLGLMEIRAYLIASSGTQQGGLVGLLKITEVRVSYAVEPLAYEPPPMVIDDAVSPGAELARVFAQVYRVRTAYQGGGGAQWWAKILSTCFWPRHWRELPDQSDMSQSDYWDCAGVNHSFNPAVTGESPSNWQDVLFRSDEQVDVYMLLHDAP